MAREREREIVQDVLRLGMLLSTDDEQSSAA
jgi:hypothetical protein